MFLADVGNGYVVGIAISCLYILYFDARLIKILCTSVAISTTVFTALDVWYKYPKVDSNDVVTYNNTILEHIRQLSNQTGEVTSYIDVVMQLIYENEQKTNATKEIMNDLSTVVNELIAD